MPSTRHRAPRWQHCSPPDRQTLMARPFPLQSLVDLSANRVEAAERRLQALDADRRSAREKLEQVEAYRREYRDRLAQTLGQGMQAAQVRDYRAFLARLDEACQQQQVEVELREAAWVAGQQDWLEQRRRKEAFNALQSRHQREESRRDARVDQRLQDDHAQAMTRPSTGDPE